MVRLGLFVGPYCGRDDTRIPERKYPKERLKYSRQGQPTGWGGSRLLLTSREYVVNKFQSRGGGRGGYNPVMSFLPELLFVTAVRRFSVFCKASD